MEATTLFGSLAKDIPLYNWSNSNECLPSGAIHATLVGAFPDLAAGMVLVLAEARGPLTGVPGDADPAHRQAVRLTRVAVTTDPLHGGAHPRIDRRHPDAP